MIISIAQAGSVHLAVLIAALVLLVCSFINRSSESLKSASGNVRFLYKAPIGFDIALQILIGGVLIFSTVLAAKGAVCHVEPLLLGYIFSIQLASTVTSRQKRVVLRGLLHRQVWVLLCASSAVALTMDILPVLLLHRHMPLRPLNSAKTLLIAACVILLMFTPRSVVIEDSWKEASSLIPTISMPSNEELSEPAPEENCSPFSYCISYGWLTKLILLGCRRKLSMDDLPPLPHYDEPLIWLEKVLDARKRGVTTLRTVAYLMHQEIITQCIFATTTALVEFVAPFAMYNLLAFLQNPEQAVLHPALWVALLFLGPTARSVSYQQYIFTSTRLIVRIKTSFVQEIYHKALGSLLFESLPEERKQVPKEEQLTSADGELPNEDDTRTSEGTVSERYHKACEECESSVGHIINLMSFDVDAIESARDIVLLCIAVPIEVAIATSFLHILIGWSAFAGLAVLLLSLSLPTFFSHKMVQVQQYVMERSDKRISMISEYLSSIRIIKYFGWERAMADKVEKVRRLEQVQIWKRNLYAIAVVWSGDFIPLFALLVMFTTYTLGTGEPLKAATAFTCLSITEVLRQQFVWVSNVSGFVSQAAVSIRRIDKFFRTAVPRTEVSIGNPSFQHATLLRSPNGDFRLHDLNIDFLPGCLNVVTGPTGCGKTSLLLSLLGETVLESGKVACPRDVAYVSQAAWLWSGTIRENILFHGAFDEVRYNDTVKACGLLRDFDELPHGDLTAVGEQGATLSGGQRQRVALARAVYSTASTLLLDDVFSALDVTTTNLIFNEFFHKGFLGDRTIILISHLQPVIDAAKLVVRLDVGRVTSVIKQASRVASLNTVETYLMIQEAASPCPMTNSLNNGMESGLPLQKTTELEKTADGRIPRTLCMSFSEAGFKDQANRNHSLQIHARIWRLSSCHSSTFHRILYPNRVFFHDTMALGMDRSIYQRPRHECWFLSWNVCLHSLGL